MSTDQLRRVEAVLEIMTTMVSADGGAVKLVSFDPEGPRLVVDYDEGPKGGCSACVLDRESLKDFIAEALESRGVALREVVVLSGAAARAGA
jgi:Fe-S cluster biogenesis protein NfuA